MLEILFMGAFTAAAFILIMAKGNIRRWLHNAVYIDIGAFIAMTLLFEGTFSGMVSAMVGGVMFSLALEVLKYFYGTEELTLQGAPMASRSIMVTGGAPFRLVTTVLLFAVASSALLQSSLLLLLLVP